MIYGKYKFRDIKDYNIALIVNYIVNQLYTFLFFSLNNLFLSFVDTVLIVITAINLYDETKKLDEKASKFLIPYILFSIFACILSATIYFMNI
jgi:tryptophan-rich sensory protein